MLIKSGDKSVHIPGWAILLTLLVVDNVAANVCRVKMVKNSK